MNRPFRDGAVRLACGFLILTLITGAGITLWHQRLAGNGGLQARYFSGENTSGPAAVTDVDHELTDAALRAGRARIPPDLNVVPTFSGLWNGYLIAPADGTYRFLVPPCVHAFAVDKRLGANDGMPSGGPPTTLRRGMHALEIQLTCDDVPAEFHIEWAKDDEPFHTIPPLLLVPELRERGEVRSREWLTVADRWLPSVWLIALVLTGAALARAAVHRPELPPSEVNAGNAFPRPLLVILLLAAALFAAGAWWGIPDIDSWAADEVVPSDVQYIIAARFAGGWATIYPPLHYAVLALSYVPHQIANALGLINLQDAVTLSSLLVVGRLVSTAMGLGIVWICYRIGADLFNRRAGILAAAVVTVSVPMAYYSKTTNLDVPYVFWLMLSLLFYLRAARDGRSRDYYLFALTATASVCTKDQVYGFYVLPAGYIALGQLAARRGGGWLGVPSFPVLLRMVVVAAVAFSVFHNLFFNFNGFREHLRLMTDLEGFRMVPRTVGGLLILTGTAIEQIGNAMSWPLLVVSVGGIALTLFAPRTRLALLLLLPALSYHLFFVCVVLYHYDRFFLGVIAIFAIFAGACLDAILDGPAEAGHYRSRIASAVVVLLIAYAFTRAVSLDLLMLRDSRYDAERWLRSNVTPQQHVVGVGFSSYLPRRSMVPWTFLRADRQELVSQAPDIVVINADFARRSREDSEGGAFYAALENGTAGYDRAAEFHATHAWPFNLDLRFGRDTNEGFSNLPKINPPIVIYRRKGGPGR